MTLSRHIRTEYGVRTILVLRPAWNCFLIAAKVRRQVRETETQTVTDTDTDMHQCTNLNLDAHNKATVKPLLGQHIMLGRQLPPLPLSLPLPLQKSMFFRARRTPSPPPASTPTPIHTPSASTSTSTSPSPFSNPSTQPNYVLVISSRLTTHHLYPSSTSNR